MTVILKVIFNVAYTDEYFIVADGLDLKYFCYPIVTTQYAY
jgi:hypothetical protein